MRSATEDMVGNDAWRLYQHFIGSVSPDCKYRRTNVEFTVGGEVFRYVGQHVITKGFTSILPWLAVSEKNLPQFTKGERINIAKVELYEMMVYYIDYWSNFYVLTPVIDASILKLA
ncbi:uncharacterized protein A4U43_C06F7080 [Asparagus officinalis]|uniref:DNA topoisomerase n=1 Tax=Asparagus officinalis TaxID=4686 RepID=A0A5P1EK78_ASPOF|nr:uncharacterized protein A4U43_C06F7080 [Asparagus officinalis]